MYLGASWFPAERTLDRVFDDRVFAEKFIDLSDKIQNKTIEDEIDKFVGECSEQTIKKLLSQNLGCSDAKKKKKDLTRTRS